MAIGDDFAIDYVNKRIYHSTGTSVYTVNQLYSWLMDVFDEQGAMDDDIPMTAQTPNAYTIVNNWFIDDESTHYLKEGAITQTRDDATIALITLSSTGYTNCVASDITKQVKDDGVEIGALLAYNNTTRKWWVRTTQTVVNGSAMTITGGTGAGTSSAFDNTGEDIFSNLYTLGTIETGTKIYIYQAGAKIDPDWWGNEHIDILVKVKEFGALTDGGTVTVYARVYTDLYDFFEIDLPTGGRNAVPLATANDLDNQTSVSTVLNYMDTIRVMHVNGTLAFTGGSGTLVAHRVIHGQTSHATAFVLNTSSPLTLANIEGTFQDAETLEQCRELKFDAQTALFTTLGQTITGGTSGATGTLRRVIQDPQASGTEGILFLTNISGTFQDNETLTGSSNGSATSNGTLSTETWTATASGTVSFATTINKDLDNGNGPQPYNVVIDVGGGRVSELYEFVKAITRRTSTITTYPTNGTDTVYKYNGEFYQKAVTTYTQVKKASPYGTFAGGKFFGARGIWVQNMSGLDAIMYSLIDANNVTQNPPLSSTIKIVSMIPSVDRVLVCESTGSGSTVIKRTQYTTATQGSGVGYVEVTTTPADDCPSTGVIRVVYDYGLGTEGEDIYTYTSINRTEKRFYISGVTNRAYDSGDRAYVPYIDAYADASGEKEVTVKYSGSTKYIVTRVRKKGYIPFQVSGSFADGTTTITAIRTVDGIVS
jgi:hypothetical protein